MTNIVTATDSYKLTHWNQYPEGTERVYSYLESRAGAEFPYTVFFGLQSILKQYLCGQKVVRHADIEEADKLAKVHFGRDIFNKAGWEYIASEHRGKLPLIIKAVPEGTVVPTGNVLMTVENTDPKCWWLTNAVESLLTHVWYPSTVATLSRSTKEVIASYLEATSDSQEGLPFMLHDFGYRGASSHESAAIGGAGHLVNFMGTDTLPAMLLALDHYQADLETLAFSVPATEHSVMTSADREGEFSQVDRVLDENPTGILSVVADSYNIYNFVNTVTIGKFKERILERDGVFVIRPDSVTTKDPNPEQLVRWILKTVNFNMGSTVNSKGYKVLNPKVRILWGDGIDREGIKKILDMAMKSGYSAENLVFGMGGGLLQKVNRDTQRFAFKCSAQMRNGEWHDIFKDPVDSTKRSKKGRLKLIESDEGLRTVSLDRGSGDDLLQTIYHNGTLFRTWTFEEIRERAALPQKQVVVPA